MTVTVKNEEPLVVFLLFQVLTIHMSVKSGTPKTIVSIVEWHKERQVWKERNRAPGRYQRLSHRKWREKRLDLTFSFIINDLERNQNASIVRFINVAVGMRVKASGSAARVCGTTAVRCSQDYKLEDTLRNGKIWKIGKGIVCSRSCCWTLTNRLFSHLSLWFSLCFFTFDGLSFL